jgi:hypothetical protein
MGLAAYRRNGSGPLGEGDALKYKARCMGVRVVVREYLDRDCIYQVQKRGWFGVWWTRASYSGEAEAIAAAERLVRGEPLHAAPPSPVVWP